MKEDGKKYWRILAICIAIILVAGFISGLIKSDFGKVIIREVRINPRGGTLSGMLYVPRSALETDGPGNYISKRPAIILSEGYLNSNQMQDPNAIELSRRGFVVLSMDMNGHGNSDSPKESDDPNGAGGILGARDFIEYIQTLPYVDTTRIGLVGHSMGGMNTGNAVAVESGFYTEADMLLNLLHDELGMEITKEDVENQNPDKLAENLSPEKFGIYTVRSQEIKAACAKRPVAEMYMGSGPGFAGNSKAHEVEVAGIPVWRDLQANVGVVIGLLEENAWLMFSASDDGINNSADIPLTTVARVLMGTGDQPVERRVWYSLNLSGSEKQISSTVLGSFDEITPDDSSLRESINNRTARVLYQPKQIHIQNHLSVSATSYVVKFFEDVMNYNNGELADGADPIDSQSSIFFIKEIANGIALAAMLFMIYPLAVILLNASFFKSLRKDPNVSTLKKNDKGFWITSIILFLLQGLTLIPFFKIAGSPTTYAGDKGPLSINWLFSQEMTNRVMVWAILNGLIALLALFIRHLICKKDGLSFKERYGLAIGKGNFWKSVLLAFILFASAYMMVVISSFFFFKSDVRFWVIAGRLMTTPQFYTWAGYLVFFFVFYLINGMVVNSGRMQNMSEGKNLAICAIMNGLGILLLEIFIYTNEAIHGHMIWYNFGHDYFLYTVVVIPMIVVLPVAAIYSRKLYNKTGSFWLGSMINTLLFTWFIVGNTCYHLAYI